MNYKKISAYILPIIGFITISLIYFYPVLQGKEILQSDITQYIGMSKETKDFRSSNQTESYWNNSAFGGMPTYQLGAKYPHNYIKKLDTVLRFLPRPADYLFLYLLGFYIVLLSLKIKPLQAFFGALFFGFSTYLIIIIGVGHNAKAHAIAYMPWLLAGVHLIFQKKYTIGAILTLLGAALELQANHFQMTYYLLILLVVLFLFFTYQCINKKELKHWLISLVLLLTSAIFAIGMNATNLMATSEYAKHSTRSKSKLTLEPDGTKKVSNDAMSYDYITQYSYGIFETFNLISPKILGGGSSESLGNDSNSYQFVTNYLQKNNFDPSQANNIVKNLPTYWGKQPIVAAPAYIGGIILLLAILALFIEKRKIKYVLAIGTFIAVIFSWGKNFFLTPLLIDYLPLYSKFRAVASIQVIAELCIPILAVLGISTFFKSSKEEQGRALIKTTTTIGIVFFVLFIAYFGADFKGINDRYVSQMFQSEAYKFVEALIADRKSMYLSSIFKTFLLITISLGMLYAVYQNKIVHKYALVIISLLAITDLVVLDLQYVNSSNFVSKSRVEQPFTANQADEFLLKQKDFFRVYDAQGGFNSGRASYFHQAFGGYHAAKPKKVQELVDYQLSQNNIEILNMYNVKYILQPNQKGDLIPTENPNANGNAWFVNKIVQTKSADETMELLKITDTKSTAILHNNYKKDIILDSLAQIKLVKNSPNELVYESMNTNNGFAVFSENYYPYGWTARIDGNEQKIIETNYTLRGLEIPKGKHIITFNFQPKVIKTGSMISLVFSVLSVIFILLMSFVFIRKRQQTI